MVNAEFVEHLGKALGIFNRGRTDQNRLMACMAGLNITNDSPVLFFFGPKDFVLLVDTNHLTVRRNHHRFQTVNVLEFVGFRVSRPRHTRKLLVHTEIVLERNGGKGLVFLLNLHAFLGLDGLMQTVGPTATGHEASRKLVHNDNLAVLNHVVLVAMEKRMGAKRGNQVAHNHDVLRRVKTRVVFNHAALNQNLFHVLMTGIR